MEKFQLSSLVKGQLPEFVRSDYPIFVNFIEKYYEWLEENNKVHYEIDALKNSYDIDDANSFYLEKLRNDLSPYFPRCICQRKLWYWSI